MKIQQILLAGLRAILLNQRHYHRLDPHLDVRLVVARLPSLRTPVANLPLMIILLPQLVDIDCVHTRKTQHHHRHITPQFGQWIHHAALRQRSRKKGPALLGAYRLLLRPVSLRYLHLAPRIRLYAYYAVVIVIILIHNTPEHLPHAHRVHLLRTACMLQVHDPPVHLRRGQLPEHDLRRSVIPLHMLQSKLVILRVTQLSSVHHTVYVQPRIIAEAYILIVLRHILDNLTHCPFSTILAV